MWPNPQFSGARSEEITEEILNGELHFLCSDMACHHMTCYIHYWLQTSRATNKKNVDKEKGENKRGYYKDFPLHAKSKKKVAMVMKLMDTLNLSKKF